MMVSHYCIEVQSIYIFVGLERYQKSTGDVDMTSAPPGQREMPTIWGYYSQMGEHYDKDLVEDANNTVDVLLIFVGDNLCKVTFH
jgi:hypothetical protein